MIKSFIRLLRPHQWLKNVFVFTGLIFAHAWHNPTLTSQAISTAIAFCLLASSVYIFNDIIDLESDRLHPTKKNRPLAQGVIAIPTAIILSLSLALLSFIIGFTVSITVGLIFISYIIINIFYNYYAKQVVILDVFTIATGFILRILAGTIGIGIPPSQWLMLCSLMITLFLGFAKRRAEQRYNPALLDKMISITATGAILTYSLYTISPETIHTHHTTKLMYAVPFVMYGIFRYIYLLHQQTSQQELDASYYLLTDKHLIFAVLGWLLITGWLII